MEITDLLNEYVKAHSAWKKADIKEELERKNINSITKLIESYFNKEFKKINKNLPKKKKITKYDVRSWAFEEKSKDLLVRIEIYKIGSKPCTGSPDEYTVPIPDYLKRKIDNFKKKYNKFNFYIAIDNFNWDSESTK